MCNSIGRPDGWRYFPSYRHRCRQQTKSFCCCNECNHHRLNVHNSLDTQREKKMKKKTKYSTWNHNNIIKKRGTIFIVYWYTVSVRVPLPPVYVYSCVHVIVAIVISIYFELRCESFFLCPFVLVWTTTKKKEREKKIICCCFGRWCDCCRESNWKLV